MEYFDRKSTHAVCFLHGNYDKASGTLNIGPRVQSRIIHVVRATMERTDCATNFGFTRPATT